MKKVLLPPRVHEKHGSYWHVHQLNGKRAWVKLSPVREGLPAMYRALARMEQENIQDNTVASLVDQWMLEISTKRKAKTQGNDVYQTQTIKAAFAEFRVSQVTPPDIAAFLKSFEDRPRSYNAYRTLLRELMRFAEEKGVRAPGTNPVNAVKTKKIPPRRRYITDSELRRIKVGICYGDDGKRTASGPMICCLVEMAYLTGQRASDLLDMEWSEIGNDGILFEPGKTLESSAVAILVQWTPRLQRLVARIKDLRLAIHERLPNQAASRFMFCKLDGQPYTYSGAVTAWKRGLKRAGIKNTQFRDLRAKALTDLDESHGIQAAQRLGGHTTQSQTADYVRHKKALKARAVR